MRDGLGIDQLYIADLDAIEGRPRDCALYERLASAGVPLWIDAGVRDRLALEPLMVLCRYHLRIVVGLESVGGPAELGEVIQRAGPDRVIFSLDMDDGRPLVAAEAAWPRSEPLEIASQVVALGVRRLILLDLARVGTGRGIGSEGLLTRIRTRWPGVAVTVGGGIRGIDDVLRLKEQGAAAVLVGSAVHDGRIGRRELQRLEEVGPHQP
jgi:phosphoribosylformimino-5-aminoimidazole carboxamide ribotide isomerase